MKRGMTLTLAAFVGLGGMVISACSEAEEPKSEAPAAAATPAGDAAAPAAAPAAEAPAPAAAPAEAAAPAAAPAAAGTKMTAYERLKATEKGKLKNPYKSTDTAIVEEGRKAYLGASCNGCHGGGGGGGMCPPVINETWVYGGDDDTLFRLITMGTDEYKKEYNASRIGQETVVGPMPGFKDIVTDEDKLWKIITFIRASWNGRAEKKTWE